MEEDEYIARIRQARRRLDEAAEEIAAAIRDAYAAGRKTGPISHAARWSDTYVRRIRDREAGRETATPAPDPARGPGRALMLAAGLAGFGANVPGPVISAAVATGRRAKTRHPAARSQAGLRPAERAARGPEPWCMPSRLPASCPVTQRTPQARRQDAPPR